MLSASQRSARGAIRAQNAIHTLADKRNNQVEMRLVAEWLQLRHKDHYYQTRVRLGSLPASVNTDELDDGEARLVHSAFARWADAVIITDDRTILVEAKVVAHPSAIAQLMLYKRLLPASPFLNLRADKPIETLLLYAREDPLVVQMAREQGMLVEQFDPPWVEEYLRTRFARQRQAPLAQEMSA